ncbi:MAG: hypothetical protein ACM3Q1_01730 [Bacteroidales bacterium]
MTSRVAALAVACMTVLIPLVPALAQVEHAQRLALDVAIRRAQVRVLMCEAGRPAMPMPTRTSAGDVTRQLPSSPPVGTAGPVDCSRTLWPAGR